MTPTFQDLSLKQKFIALAAAGFFYVWDRHLLHRMTHGDWLTREMTAAQWLSARRAVREMEKKMFLTGFGA